MEEEMPKKQEELTLKELGYLVEFIDAASIPAKMAEVVVDLKQKLYRMIEAHAEQGTTES